MTVRLNSGFSQKALGVVVVLAVLGVGAFVWLTRSDGDAQALQAPAKPCWNGTPRQATMQKLLGPGKELTPDNDEFRVIKEHWPSHCEYKALSEEGGLAPVLNVDVAWNNDPPPREELPTTDARGDEPRTRMDMGVLAYYLRASQVVFFECDVDFPADTPAYMKRDKYIEVDVYAQPMKGTGLTAVAARKVGLDIMLQLAHDLADQAGCKNNTNLPSSVPSITKANWPGY